jgi:predicted DNA-binding transcriptional regulator AlpA
LYRLVAAGGLPPPIKVGSISLWARADLDEWIQRKRGEVVP